MHTYPWSIYSRFNAHVHDVHPAHAGARVAWVRADAGGCAGLWVVRRANASDAHQLAWDHGYGHVHALKPYANARDRVTPSSAKLRQPASKRQQPA